jgi:hypothetical protein
MKAGFDMLYIIYPYGFWLSAKVYGPFTSDTHVNQWITSKQNKGWDEIFHITELTGEGNLCIFYTDRKDITEIYGPFHTEGDTTIEYTNIRNRHPSAYIKIKEILSPQ